MKVFKRLFKKNKEQRKLGWNDLTLTDLMQIKSISDLQLATEDEKNLKVAAIVCKVPYDKLIQMPLSEVREYMDQTEFLFHAPKPRKVKHTYIINGRRYKLLKNEMEMLTSQYIDFQAIYKDGFDKRPGELLAVMMVPEGHEYNDGYDNELVVKDMYDMKVEEALGITDFFTRRFVRLIERTKMFYTLIMKWKKMTATKEEKEMIKVMEIQMNLMRDEINSTYGWTALKP